MDENQKHFVLVHGTCHGAWCWYKIIPLLRGAGHRVTALDLGASGIDSKQVDEVPSLWDYVKPLMEFMATIPHDEKVILVGHSYGGLPISLAMERFPHKILVAVFVTAYLPHYSSPPGTLIQEVRKSCYFLTRILSFCTLYLLIFRVNMHYISSLYSVIYLASVLRLFVFFLLWDENVVLEEDLSGILVG